MLTLNATNLLSVLRSHLFHPLFDAYSFNSSTVVAFINTSEEFVIDGVPDPHTLSQPTSLVHRQCVMFVFEKGRPTIPPLYTENEEITPALTQFIRATF